MKTTMTIKEAFEKYHEISIDYVFECKCYECDSWYDELDEEFSFEGDIEDFALHQDQYGVLQLDDEIIQKKDNRFWCSRVGSDEGLCPSCREED